MDAGVLLVIVVLAVLVAIVLLFLSTRRQPTARCPGCRRAVVPGRTGCPWCNTPYVRPGVVTEVDRSLSPSPTQAPRLICIEGPSKGQVVPIRSSRFTIGRTRDNQLLLDGQLVSRSHAVIERSVDGQYVLFDVDSTNGTWVNGRRVGRHGLNPGDQIHIGPFVFCFEGPDGRVGPKPVVKTDESLPAPGPVSDKQLAEYDWPVAEVGGGGMATVYKGISRRDGSAVAIKIFHQVSDSYIKGKNEQERRIGWELSHPPHPHIATVLGSGTANGRDYIIMEFVDYGSLRERLRRDRPLPVEVVVPVIGQTCDALQYAHRRGITHRDIKPENILFASNGGIKLVDFGIAKWGTQITHTIDGMLIGTPLYMSCEQADGATVDARSDIYSLGIVLYEMLTGRPPFQGDPMAIVHKHVHEEPIPPRRLNPAISAQMEAVVMRALSKKPNKRFQCAEDMARAVGYRAPFYTPGVGPAPMAATDRRAPQFPGPAAARRPRRAGQPTEARPSVSLGRLVVEPGGRTLTLGYQQTLIGRDLNPEDKKISHEHARIMHSSGQFWLEDCQSVNGTWLNEIRIFERRLLRDGDVIRVGHTPLRVELPGR